MASSSSRASGKNGGLSFLCGLLISKFKCSEAKAEAEAEAEAEAVSGHSPQLKHDVFVSFRGEDTRDGFLSHLIKALSQKQIVAFVDHKLRKGDEISQALSGAIEGSLISLVIFSEDYASSHWCLDELVKIAECGQKNGQIVIPVFYKVHPTVVRHQKGSFGNAFAEHGNKYGEDKLHIWRSALNEIANTSGFHFPSTTYRNEADLIEKIVDNVLGRLKHMYQAHSKGLVGIDKPIAHLESLLRQESRDVRVIGVWGMGGIGKTTMAQEVFDKLYPEYEGGCFLANVREESQRHGIMSLKNKLFSTLLAEEDLKIDTPNGLPHYIERRLCRKKVIVVLDDVNNSKQLEILIGFYDRSRLDDLFGTGSIIIVTTRDKHVLAEEIDDHDIYEVQALEFDDSLRLFNLNALKQNHLETDFYELSKRMVNYAAGVPLVLKVLGRLLRGKKDKEIWESQLEKLKKMSSKGVHDVMKLSYDDLDREEQKIFLDIACFFHGLNLKVDFVKLLLKDGDCTVAYEIERLKDKALITISKENIVSMHDIIQEMAWEIVRQESVRGPGNQSRLWEPDGIHQILKNNHGSEAIRSISINLLQMEELQLSPRIFAKMSRLQYLNFYRMKSQGKLDLPQQVESLPNERRHLPWPGYPLNSSPINLSVEKLIMDLQHSRVQNLRHGAEMSEGIRSIAANLPVIKELQLNPDLVVASMNELQFMDFNSLTDRGVFYLPQGLESLPNELKYLGWMHYPLKSLPEKFSAEKLVILKLPYSSVEKLWQGVQNVVNLKVVKLQFSSSLMELPNFLRARKLEVLDLRWCVKLTSVHPSVFSLKKIEILDLSGCISLTSLPSNIHSSSIRYLSLFGCIHLEKFSVTSENMTELNLELTGIQELPLSIGCQNKLETLRLAYSRIKHLPSSIKHLTRLRHLDLDYCSELQTVPELPPSLEKLDARCCRSLGTIFFPSTEQLKKIIKRVVLWNCFRIGQYNLKAPYRFDEQKYMMNFARQRVLELAQVNFEDHEGRATYVYPGGTIPEWLEYRTTQDYMTIDLSSYSSPLGFIFCFLVPWLPVEGLVLKFSISFEGEEDGSTDIYLDRPRQAILMGHVCLIYDQQCSRHLSVRAKSQPRFRIKVVGVSLLQESQHVPLLLQGFGVSPISTTVINLSDSN